MKVAIIRKKYTFHGGAESFSGSFIEKLANDGHEMHVFAIKWQADGTHKNIYFHQVPAVTFNSFLRDLSFAISSYFILKKQRNYFDIIQTHDKTMYQDIYRAGDGCHIEWLRQRWKRTGLLGKLSIVLNPYHWLILDLEHKIFIRHRYKKIIAISEMVKRNIIDNYSVPASDIEVIYNGVDTEKFHPGNREKYRDEIRRKHGLAENDFVALFMGSGFERKGVGALIEAVKGMEGPVKVLVVGKGKHPPVPNIIFCGPQKDNYKYYAAADIFVFPTIYEPFGNVHLEALASGLPVITTKNSGAAEIIKDGAHGYVIPEPEDVRTIAEKIRFFMTNRDKLESMSANARQLAEEFTFEKHIEKIQALYERILDERGNPSP
ncbi:MAG: glycosyltransferase family 1 protein [Nitrospiraceae bacterium]|nr:MAG: glycosyltransferase family 1 protein [Nitrospiraceae bacterium]